MVHAIKPMSVLLSQSTPSTATLDGVLKSFRDCAPIFLALGDKFRQDIIMVLAEAQRLNVTQISERIPLSRPAISHHLKVLKQAGLIELDRVSRENFYLLSLDSALSDLRRLVEQAETSCT